MFSISIDYDSERVFPQVGHEQGDMETIIGAKRAAPLRLTPRFDVPTSVSAIKKWNSFINESRYTFATEYTE